MKQTIITMLLAVMATVCSAQVNKPRPVEHVAPSPCEDSLYNALKTKPLNELSEREYSYFSQKGAECSKYNQTMVERAPAAKMAKTTSNAITAYIVIAVVSAVLSVAYIASL